MNLGDFIRGSCKALASVYPEREARNIVLWLCSEELGVKDYAYITEPDMEIPEDKLDVLKEKLDRLMLSEPIQYVLGNAEFCSRVFKVNSSVLIPRPETEQMAMDVVALAKTLGGSPRVLDLCTGSGCIAWTVKKEVPEAEVTAVDISREALDVARAQFDGPSPDFVLGDVLDVEKDFGRGEFDIIVSNPPYIMEREKAQMRKNVLDYEPGLALFVPDTDPLKFYRAVASWARKYLKPSGVGFVEINEQLGDETGRVFRDAGFPDVNQSRDLFNKIRYISFKKH